MNDIKNWLNDVASQGYLCRDYINRIKYATNKAELFKIVCDSNGISFIPNLKKNRIRIPYEMLDNEFGKFINGKVKPLYDDTYNSCMYMNCLEKAITIDTTLACLIGYSGEVIIPKNHCTRICLDYDCRVTFVMEENARLIVECYNNQSHLSIVNIVGDQSRVKIKNM